MHTTCQSDWIKTNGSMSDKSAIDEFGLTYEEIIEGIQSGKLQYRKNNAHGNPYLKLIRREIETFVTQKYGEHYTANKIKEKKLKDITKEINSMKRKVTALEKIKIELLKNIATA
ncbi:hypothetical protein TUM19329_36600 (plasmid) [Legionella antarctica]|uniref:Uncharacterized protein n=1 Tax=Legionella antarctica TaxID=2708020 RepID=A0A6F8TB23_9GAMM|nr:hypothetical protein TUM19329_00910 [Legionella antarctica]BCA97186.1 hypothetical protein TUM19329_35470 [Legionella antarctica]BCA97299.1 hypothetical protein TUM19329_36600 [Legionella antarctica]